MFYEKILIFSSFTDSLMFGLFSFFFKSKYVWFLRKPFQQGSCSVTNKETDTREHYDIKFKIINCEQLQYSITTIVAVVYKSSILAIL